MVQGCNRSSCDGAAMVIDDNGVTDPEKTRIETWECEYGHQFTKTLAPL
jgi:hypothetical protein